jgi:hypothetical protein
MSEGFQGDRPSDGPERQIQKAPLRAEGAAAAAAAPLQGQAAKRGFCEHGRKKSRCRECGGGSFCEHNVQRYNCHKCIQARCIASLVESLRSTVASTVGGCSDQAKIMLLELQVKALTEQRDSLLQILEQNQLFALQSQVGFRCMSCMQNYGPAL